MFGFGRMYGEPNFGLRIARWSGDAKLFRVSGGQGSPKLQSKVTSGKTLVVGDRLVTAANSVDVVAGDIGYKRIKPNSIIKYLALRPTLYRFGSKIEIRELLEKGTVLNKVSSLTADSSYFISGAGKITGCRGTSYAVTASKSTLTLIVAEGRVSIRLESDPEANELIVEAGQKVIFGAAGPARAVPVAVEDAAIVTELLNLPSGLLGGYFDTEPSFSDNTEPTVLGVFQRPLLDGMGDYSPKFAPNSVDLVAVDDFWTVDAAGRRSHPGAGLRYENTSPDGKWILATKLGGGLFRVPFEGGPAEKLSDLPLGFCQTSPDMSHYVADSPGMLTSKAPKTFYYGETKAGSIPQVIGARDAGPADDHMNAYWLNPSDKFVAEVPQQDSTNVFGTETGLSTPIDAGISDLQVTPQRKWAIWQKTVSQPKSDDPKHKVQRKGQRDTIVYYRLAEKAKYEGINCDDVLVGEQEFTTGNRAFSPSDFTKFRDLTPYDRTLPGGSIVDPSGTLVAFIRAKNVFIGDIKTRRSINTQVQEIDNLLREDFAWTSRKSVLANHSRIDLGIKRLVRARDKEANSTYGVFGNSEITTISVDNGDVTLSALNNVGQVAGTIRREGLTGFIWDKGKIVTQVPLPEGSEIAGLTADGACVLVSPTDGGQILVFSATTGLISGPKTHGGWPRVFGNSVYWRDGEKAAALKWKVSTTSYLNADVVKLAGPEGFVPVAQIIGKTIGFVPGAMIRRNPRADSQPEVTRTAPGTRSLRRTQMPAAVRGAKLVIIDSDGTVAEPLGNFLITTHRNLTPATRNSDREFSVSVSHVGTVLADHLSLDGSGPSGSFLMSQKGSTIMLTPPRIAAKYSIFYEMSRLGEPTSIASAFQSSLGSGGANTNFEMFGPKWNGFSRYSYLATLFGDKFLLSTGALLGDLGTTFGSVQALPVPLGLEIGASVSANDSGFVAGTGRIGQQSVGYVLHFRE